MFSSFGTEELSRTIQVVGELLASPRTGLDSSAISPAHSAEGAEMSVRPSMMAVAQKEMQQRNLGSCTATLRGWVPQAVIELVAEIGPRQHER